MTLVTGHPIKNRRSRCAFTLVELILVMVLLVVAISIVVPRMTEFMRGRALDSEARRMLAIMHAGQARAVSEGMPVMLWIDEKKNGYGIEEETPAQKTDPQAESYTADDNVKVAVMNLNGSGTTFNSLPAIRFLADGTADENSPQAVKLTGYNGGALWLLESADRRGYEISDSDKL
jgi:prepilin-type N-terminal cleavage/methylation domain-containing protein